MDYCLEKYPGLGISAPQVGVNARILSFYSGCFIRFLFIKKCVIIENRTFVVLVTNYNRTEKLITECPNVPKVFYETIYSRLKKIDRGGQ